ncbi:RNA polymerase sigma factor [Reyranella sp. CPCC 100927]|uniref:RNA polymerase sigma factor n=1 Tax=Reyranella sp. CPCC 100927 TaxID=2599616 RepID=UPI0011B8254B|nr:sigma-70 family RNA polymerase sigma factor [Reyranella sp. CPCC 100927]TWT11520.1 sigma-70 family RNA polymerase sigma factor [Reyranella sp. CPCC 100927]
MDDIAALIEPHVPALRRYAWALLRDDDAADDLVQDCLERAIGRWHLRRRDGDLRAWLFTILRNHFIGGLRQTARRGVHVSTDAMTVPPSSAAPQEDRMVVRDVLAGLDALPEEQRSVLLLVSVEDLSYQDAARVLDVPVGTVMSRLSRARERLRQYLETGRAGMLRRVK